MAGAKEITDKNKCKADNDIQFKEYKQSFTFAVLQILQVLKHSELCHEVSERLSSTNDNQRNMKENSL